jgi:hypothetical protein
MQDDRFADLFTRFFMWVRDDEEGKPIYTEYRILRDADGKVVRNDKGKHVMRHLGPQDCPRGSLIERIDAIQNKIFFTGGIGPTTIAKAVYYRLRPEFSSSSYSDPTVATISAEELAATEGLFEDDPVAAPVAVEAVAAAEPETITASDFETPEAVAAVEALIAEEAQEVEAASAGAGAGAASGVKRRKRDAEDGERVSKKKRTERVEEVADE